MLVFYLDGEDEEKKGNEARKDGKQCEVMDYLTGRLHKEPEGHTGCLICVFAQHAGLSLGGLKGKTMPESSPQKRDRRGNLPASLLLSFVFHYSKLPTVGADSSTLLIILSFSGSSENQILWPIVWHFLTLKWRDD